MKLRHLLWLLLVVGCAKTAPNKVQAAYHPAAATTPGTSTAAADESSANARAPAFPDAMVETPAPSKPAIQQISPAKSPQVPTDAVISDRVRQAILDDETVAMVLPNVHVATLQGIVTLSGSVRSPDDMQRIEIAAKGVSGVVRVDDRLEVKADLARDISNPPVVTGTDGSSSDPAISQRIHQAILDDATVAADAPKVIIAVKSGAVTLSGTVKSQANKDRIETLARSMAGSLRVDDQLEVAKETAAAPSDSAESPPDRIISEKVRQAIADDGTVAMDSPTVIVATANAVVTLTGSVSKPANKERIETLARDVVGVTRVDNQLEVKEDSTTTTSEEAPADRAISEKVRKAISDDVTVGSEAANIKVGTDRGIVTLSGSVKNLINKRRVEVLAAGVSGVKRVENKLDVRGG